jgi:hypothetical protein
MGTFLKYLVYALIILAIYIVVRGWYDGDITQNTTVGEVMSQVDNGTKEMAHDAMAQVDKMSGQATQARQHQ